MSTAFEQWGNHPDQTREKRKIFRVRRQDACETRQPLNTSSKSSTRFREEPTESIETHGDKYERRLRDTLANEQLRELYQCIRKSENEWIPFEEISEEFLDLDDLDLTKELRHLQRACLIERGLAKINGQDISLYRTDSVLPEYKYIIDEYLE